MASSTVAPGTSAAIAARSSTGKRRLSKTRWGDTTALKRVAFWCSGHCSRSPAKATAAGMARARGATSLRGDSSALVAPLKV